MPPLPICDPVNRCRYVCAEWFYGGMPVWLRHTPGMVFRDDDSPWETAMARWVTYVVDMMKAANMFAPQGGPVIMAQVRRWGTVNRW